MGLFSRSKQEAHVPAPAPAPHAGAGHARPSATGGGQGTAARAQARENARINRRSDREMQLERARLQADEKKIQAEIKSLVRQNRIPEARILSKNLIQVRNAQTKLFGASTQLAAIQNQTSVMQSQAKVVGAMHNASQMLSSATNAANPERMMKMAQAYEMESGKAQMAQEMTDDALDGILGGDEVDQEGEDVLNSVLEEIGMEIGGRMSSAPVARPAQQQRVQIPQGGAMSEEDALLQRLAALEGQR